MATPKVREYKIKLSQQGAQQVQRQVDGIGKSFNALKAIATTVVTSTITQTLLQFGRLAATSDRLRTSFDNLAQKEGADANVLMQQLREATKGTVSQIELMRNATQARFLGIDLKNLPTLFEFARRRARDTGQSVEYLVQSIVTGIGRRSALILDNLGIQIRDLNEEMKRIAISQGTWNGKIDENIQKLYFQQAALNIAQKGIQEAGAETDDMIDATDRLGAAWEDFSVTIGRAVSPVLTTLLTQMSNLLNAVISFQAPQVSKGNFNIGFFEGMAGAMGGVTSNAQKMFDVLNMGAKDVKALSTPLNEVSENTNKAATSIFNLNRVLASFPRAEQLSIRQLGSDVETLSKNFDLIEVPDLRIQPETLNGWDIFRARIEETSDILAFSFFQQFEEGENIFQAFGDAFVQMLERMAAEIIARSAIFGVLSFLGLGPVFGGGGFLDFVFGGLFRQHGGPVERNQPYVVGESGPELFIPEQSGNISPTLPTGNTYNITVAVPPGGDVKAFEDFLRYRGGAQAVANTLPELI